MINEGVCKFRILLSAYIYSMEKKEKKLTASQVCKNYGLTPDELDKLLEQIFNELEKTEGDEEGGEN